MTQFQRLVEIMAQLRGRDGCPWDREQTHETLRPYMLEECHEALEAIDSGDPAKLCAELGDVLLQVVFHAQVASENGGFDIEDVCRRISDKLEFRHPHVFGEVDVSGSDEVIVNWEQLKRQEKETGPREFISDGIPQALPALMKAAELQKRAARVGFDWEDISGPLEKLDEELNELTQALSNGSQAEQLHELGDVLFVLANIARHAKIDAEDALRIANRRFTRRFERLKELAVADGNVFDEMTLKQMDVYWEQAKGEE